MSRIDGLLRVLTVHCDSASELSSRELDGPLSHMDRAALYCHLIACRSCRRFRAQIRLSRRAARSRTQLAEKTQNSEGQLSPEARNRIAAACRHPSHDSI